MMTYYYELIIISLLSIITSFLRHSYLLCFALLHTITISLLHIITSLLRHYYRLCFSLLHIITSSLLHHYYTLWRHYYSLLQLLLHIMLEPNSCNNGSIIAHYYKPLDVIMAIITHHYHYYPLLRVKDCQTVTCRCWHLLTETVRARISWTTEVQSMIGNALSRRDPGLQNASSLVSEAYLVAELHIFRLQWWNVRETPYPRRRRSRA